MLGLVPFRSRKQQAWAYATKQPFRKRWAKATKFKGLPKRVRSKKRR